MSCYPSRSRFGSIAILLLGICAPLGLLAPCHCVADTTTANDQTDRAANRAHIECITPDGQRAAVPNTPAADRVAPALIIDDETISCALREGETTFLITLPKNALHDRFTFVNENAAACGELRIAVSNSPLPADSTKWIEVDGIIPFAHKRLFSLSMLGVETKFVRLSFHVENSGENAASRDRETARIAGTFRASALAEAINSSFSRLHAQRRDVSVSFAPLSVSPLSAASKK